MSSLNQLSELLSLVDVSTQLGAVSHWLPEFILDMKPRQRVTWLLPIAYMVGSIPFGLVVGRMKGVDLLSHGSRNIGATNAGRLLGRKYFFIVFFLDMLKSLLPMLAAMVLLSDAKEQQNGQLTMHQYIMWLAVGFVAIIGHMFSAFLKFKGGKGIATSAGVILGLFPYFTLPGVGVFLTWVVLFKAFRYVSLASIVAAITFPFFYIGVGLWLKWPITTDQLPLGIFAVIVAILIVVKHRGNIRRLMQGQEPHYHPRSSHHEHRHGEAEASA